MRVWADKSEEYNLWKETHKERALCKMCGDRLSIEETDDLCYQCKESVDLRSSILERIHVLKQILSDEQFLQTNDAKSIKIPLVIKKNEKVPEYEQKMFSFEPTTHICSHIPPLTLESILSTIQEFEVIITNDLIPIFDNSEVRISSEEENEKIMKMLNDLVSIKDFIESIFSSIYAYLDMIQEIVSRRQRKIHGMISHCMSNLCSWISKYQEQIADSALNTELIE